MKFNYAINQIKKHWNDPGWWHTRFVSRVAGPVLGELYRQKGINYMDEDWDNLIILDACRADMFEETIGTDPFDKYRRVTSVGSSSPEWMENTFSGREFPDTVYLSGNPWIAKTASSNFHDLINIWVDEFGVDKSELEENIVLGEVESADDGTVHPDAVNRAARQVHEKYPNKRLIIHYFQPHAPVCGNADGTPREEINHDLHPGAIRESKVSRDQVWQAYVENLQYVYHHASSLAEELGGRSVFTADHGELFGEWMLPFPIRGYMHPSGVRHPKLTTVPWAVKEHGPRRDVEVGSVSSVETDSETVDSRLRDLGYKV